MNIQAVEDGREGFGHDVDAFLPDEASDEADEGDISLGKSELCLKGALAVGFAFKVVDIEAGWDVGVGGGVPDLFIDAVEDPVEGGASFSEHPVELCAVLACLDFVGVGR